MVSSPGRPFPAGTRQAAASLLLLLLFWRDAAAQKGDGCGHTVFGPESGTFTTINYPYTYPNNTVCEWEIRVKPEQRVQLKFGHFDIDDSDSCHSSYVRVYNGIGPTRTEIGKYCGLGLQMDSLIESKSNEVTVQFMSGIHFYGHGFLASYSTTEKTGAPMDPVQLNTGAELLHRTIKWGFCLTVLTLYPVISGECQGERNCTFMVGRVVQEGDSVEVPLNTSKTILDLCVWDNLTMRWVYVWDFSSGKKYSSSFKEHVCMVGRTFRLLNVSKDTHGSYKLQDDDANCVALINVSVRDLETTTHLPSSSAPGLTYPRVTTGDHRLHWVFLLQFLAVLLFTL